MFLKTKCIIGCAAILALLLFVRAERAQDSTGAPDQQRKDTLPGETGKATDNSLKYRLLQDNGFLVDTAYLEDEGEFEHRFTFERARDRSWSAVFTEEITAGSERHQLEFSIPGRLAGNGSSISAGLGDAQIEYSHGLYGNSSSRITVSPGVELSFPIGSSRKGLGAGGPSLSFKIPVGVLLTKRFASNSILEVTYTKSARNTESECADTVGYEVGQSFVWFAKPKLNFFVEALWERSQEVAGNGVTENERSFLVSPAVRWAHKLRNGLTITPGIAMPIGVGPSRGDNRIFFFIAFSHPFKREIE